MGFCCCIPGGLQDKEAGMISDGFDEGTVRYLGKRYWARQTQAIEAARIIREFDEQPEELEFHR